MKRRILICEFYHETNTFNPQLMDLEGFKAIRYAEGKDLYDICKKLPCCSFHGLVDAVEEAGAEVVPTVSLFGCAGGKVTDRAYQFFKERMAQYISEAGHFDALFCSLHGATSLESDGDACGVLLEDLRAMVGPEMVIAACFDLHANITEKILRNADVVTGYQTYPHLDFYETGYRAGQLGMKKLLGETFYQAAAILPLLTPPSGYTNMEEPFKGVIDMGKEACEKGEILDFSVFNVQPWMDIPVLGSTVVVLAKTEQAACEKATAIAEKFFSVRDGLWPELMDLDSIIDLAEDPAVPKPVVLGDSADSPNSGSVGDSVAHALRVMERGSSISMCLFVKDPEAVEQAFAVGVGNSAEFSVGAKLTANMPGPLKAMGTVRSLHDGVFRMEGPGARGTICRIGKCAVLSFGNIDIMVCEAPVESGDPQLLRHFGIEPTFYDLVVAKANTSFLVPYGKFAGRICYGDTPGAGAANLKRFQWKNIPKGMYPFDLPEDYKVKPAQVYR